MKERFLFSLFKIFSNIIKRIKTTRKINFINWLANKYLNLKSANKRKRVIKSNLNYALPYLNEKEINNITFKSIKNLGMNAIQAINNYNQQTLKDLTITVENEDIVLNALKENKKIIFVTAHFGNWELLTSLISIRYKKLLAIYKKLKHDTFNDYLLESRQNSGLEMKEKHGGIKPLIKSLKNGEPIGLLIDQGTSLDNGIEVTHFGKKTYFIPSASQLSRMTGAVIIPIFIYTDDYLNYKLKVFEEIKCDKTKDKEKDMFECTQKQANIFEKAIKEQPELWFWSHKRWRYTNSELYN